MGWRIPSRCNDQKKWAFGKHWSRNQGQFFPLECLEIEVCHHIHSTTVYTVGKSSSYSLYNCFGKIKACCHWIDCVSPYHCAISLKCISPYCRVHFSLLHLAFKMSCSPHTKSERDRNRRVLSEKLIVKAKWNRLYWKPYSNSAPPQNSSLLNFRILFCICTFQPDLKQAIIRLCLVTLQPQDFWGLSLSPKNDEKFFLRFGRIFTLVVSLHFIFLHHIFTFYIFRWYFHIFNKIQI